MIKIAVCVLVVYRNSCEFLSVSLKEDHTDFNLPGGKVELGEELIQTGIRETREETGINVYNLEYLYEALDDNYQVVTYFTHNYDGNIYTKENHKVKWLPLYELTNSKKWPEYNSTIYDKYLDKVNKN